MSNTATSLQQQQSLKLTKHYVSREPLYLSFCLLPTLYILRMARCSRLAGPHSLLGHGVHQTCKHHTPVAGGPWVQVAVAHWHMGCVHRTLAYMMLMEHQTTVRTCMPCATSGMITSTRALHCQMASVQPRTDVRHTRTRGPNIWQSTSTPRAATRQPNKVTQNQHANLFDPFCLELPQEHLATCPPQGSTPTRPIIGDTWLLLYMPLRV
jgi:hypothetical protein